MSATPETILGAAVHQVFLSVSILPTTTSQQPAFFAKAAEVMANLFFDFTPTVLANF
jgi:hypothetical protein